MKDNTENSSLWKKLAFPATVIFIIFCFGRDFIFYRSFHKCSLTTKARIIGKSKTSNGRNSRRAPKLNLIYIVDGKEVRDANTVPLSYFKSKNVGDTISIKYACDYVGWSYITEIEDQSLFRFLPKSWFR